MNSDLDQRNQAGSYGEMSFKVEFSQQQEHILETSDIHDSESTIQNDKISIENASTCSKFLIQTFLEDSKTC